MHVAGREGYLDLTLRLIDERSGFLKSRFPGQDRIPSLVLRAAAWAAGMNSRDKVRMPGGHDVTVDELDDAYGDLLATWESNYPDSGSAMKALRASLHDVKPVYRRIGQQTGCRLVCIGHTHDDDWTEGVPEVGGRPGASVNTGAWSGRRQTWVRMVLDGSRAEIRRHTWGQPRPETRHVSLES